MPIPKAQLKAFMEELSKIGDKPVAKALNKIVFQPSDEEVAMQNPQLQQTQVPGQPPGADYGNNQSSNVVGNSQAVTPAMGPGGV